MHVSVYPCVYREHLPLENRQKEAGGLSLCIQGTQFHDRNTVKPSRFIPVYTGNTVVVLLSKFFIAVYPCVYREHTSSAAVFMFSFGLSLCIQGTPLLAVPANAQLRFIPVYTGNTSDKKPGALTRPVYPCVYREHTVANTCSGLGDGLSLCIQGTLSDCIGKDIRYRFIPVYTGNTPICCL